MKFLKTYRNILIQGGVLLLIALYKHQLYLGIFSVCLCLLPAVSPYLARQYMHAIEKILAASGYWIKNILFFLLYFLIFCPVALLQSRFGKKSLPGFNVKNKDYTSADFEKMW